jgi:hypothetical protein
MKVAVCIPVHSRPETRFMANLLELFAFTHKTRPDIELVPSIWSASDLCHVRHVLVLTAMDAGADYMLCMDADQSFPQDSLLRLLAHDVDVVGCNYRRRIPPYRPTASKAGAFVETTRERANATPLEQVDSLGLGLVLVRMAVLRRLKEGGGLMPLFAFTVDAAGHNEGEDTYFFRKLGVPVWCDNALSMEVGHIGELVIGFTTEIRTA